jgi:hypothetical protein
LVVGQKRSSLKRSELWFLRENQTRAGRPARVKVCKDQSLVGHSWRFANTNDYRPTAQNKISNLE